MIPYGRQSIDDDDVRAVCEALRSDWLTQGPAVERFERMLAERCEARHAVAVANGTVALHLACLAGGVKPGDEGITSPLTFAASANCLLYAGAGARFADIDPSTWNIDPAQVRARVTGRTKVIVPVDFAGLPCDLAALRAIADSAKALIIEDACHALGATYRGKPVGGTGLSDMTVFSFHPVKHVTTGEGGAVLTDDAVLDRRLRRLRHHGITKDPAELRERHGPWYYEIQELGYNGRITDIQCALGASQLAKLDRFVTRRREIAAAYRTAFGGIEGLAMQAEPEGHVNSHHLFVVNLDPARFDRRALFEEFLRRGISPQVHYYPVHLQPLHRRLCGTGPGDFPVAERYYRGAISLPMFPALGEREVAHVIESVRGALGV